MRVSLTADEIATLDLALQDRQTMLRVYGGRGPLVQAQAAACWALRTKLQRKPAKPKPKTKRKSRTQRAA